MKQRSWILIGIILGCVSASCNSDDAKLHTGTRCHATYVIDESSTICYFGDCSKYDSILRDHYCPSEAPLCVKDEAGHFYCGSACPEGSLENRSAEEFASMCRCDIEQCLNTKSHEGWGSAECDEDNKCKALECKTGYILHDGNCLTSMQCCGNDCKPCAESDGWKSGSCQNGKCIAESCLDGYHTSEDSNGNVYCLNDTSEACGDSGIDCPPNFICNPDTFVCECAPELTECDGDCFDLQNDIAHCGSCETACDVAHADNQCSEGICKFICIDEYIESEDATSCIKDIQCPEKTKNCDDVCIDIMADINNCGECGQKCENGTCKDGKCMCPENQTICNGVCTDLSKDSKNCGKCGEACPEEMTCSDKVCKCPEGKEACGNTCVTLNTNENCSKCGDECTGGKSCQDKVCKCPDGQVVCDEICVELNTDDNCSKCGDVCSGGKTCQDKVCQCPSGMKFCSETCVDTTSDPSNCGECDNVCSVDCSESICQCDLDEINCNNKCISSYQMGVVIALSSLSSYDAPDNTSNIVETYSFGSSVKIYAIEKDKFVTLYNGQKAYINPDYVFMMPTYGSVTAINGITLYKYYNSSDVITTLKKNTQVTIVDFKQTGSVLWFKLSKPQDGFTNESSYISRNTTNGDDRSQLPNCSK